MILRKAKNFPCPTISFSDYSIEASTITPIKIEEINVNELIRNIWYGLMPFSKLTVCDKLDTHEIELKVEFFSEGTLRTIGASMTMETLYMVNDVYDYLKDWLVNLYDAAIGVSRKIHLL